VTSGDLNKNVGDECIEEFFDHTKHRVYDNFFIFLSFCF